MANLLYCVRCGRTVTPNQVKEGEAIETARGTFCPLCAPRAKSLSGPALSSPLATPAAPVPEPVPLGLGDEAPHENVNTEEQPAAPPPVQEPPAPPLPDARIDAISELLQRILTEVTPISRSMLYEKASIWNLLGAVGQILSLTLLLVAVVVWQSSGPTNILLVAILVQLMTLTCFLRGK
jgi:hypothetical protein